MCVLRISMLKSVITLLRRKFHIMSQPLSNKSTKGKEVLVDRSVPKRHCHITPGTLCIHENLIARLECDSDDENIPPPMNSSFGINSTLTSYATTTQAECSNARKTPLQPSQNTNIMSAQTISMIHCHGTTPNYTQESRELARDRERLRRQRMTDRQREECNARRRAAAQNQSPEVREGINASRRNARVNQPADVMAEVNATRRAARRTAEVREEVNASRRTARQNQPAEVREEVNARRRNIHRWLGVTKHPSLDSSSGQLPMPRSYAHEDK